MSGDDEHGAHRRLQATTFWLVKTTDRALERAIHRRFDATGLRTRYVYGILSVLDEGGGVAQAQIGRRLGVDPSDMVAALNELEGLGHVRRERDPDDRRRNRVVLTEPGRALLAHLDAEIAAAEDEVLDALDAAQRRTLHELLGKLG